MNSTLRSWGWPLAMALSCLILGGFSGAVSADGGSGEWYRGLVKTPGTPPSWLFGPVWSLLYLLMGWAAGLLIVRKAWRALCPFGLQFVLNLLWSPVFFGLREPEIALGVIVAMLLLIVRTMVIVHRTCPPVVCLTWPYLGWVAYATWLNAGIVWLNP
ncbi:MAG: tryptophan-rich sensory protein [Verrucomicrobia bacterium]|nr:MAG: tryptophan-rich sensory protein [Verrucomicrobiota bacterium]TAE86952.1 MAG: tryptophan-rich sensory protein [Verrucomicrobiota bacterium]TAF24743.1 MAG: tryptophan-rich sensory protein [Verrucomicrobiota bacterium]